MTNAEFDIALRQAARTLTQQLPLEKLRIDRGLVLALNGAASYDHDRWYVCSASDPEVRYRLGPEGCDCPDRQRAPDGRCKHYLAVYLTHAAMQTELTQLTEEQADGNV